MPTSQKAAVSKTKRREATRKTGTVQHVWEERGQKGGTQNKKLWGTGLTRKKKDLGVFS